MSVSDTDYGCREAEQYHRELVERFPDFDERMEHIEQQVEGASDFSRPFTPEDEPDNTPW